MSKWLKYVVDFMKPKDFMITLLVVAILWGLFITGFLYLAMKLSDWIHY